MNSVPTTLSAAPNKVKSVSPIDAIVYVRPTSKLLASRVVIPADSNDFSVHTPEGSVTTYVGGLEFPNA